MKIECIQSIEAFHGLEKEWTDLHETSGNGSIFLTWDWMFTWWEIYQDNDKELFIVSIREEDGKLLGIAPLMKNLYKWKNILTIRQIRFLGTGEREEDEVCSEYLDFILNKNHNREEILRILMGWFNNQDGWDEIIFEQIAEDSCLRQMIKVNEMSKSYSLIRKIGDSSYLTLPESWDDLLAGMSSNQRYRIKKTLRELEKIGTIDLLETVSEEDLEKIFSILVELHQKNWNSKGKPGVFSSGKFREFHEKITRKFLQKNQLFLAAMTVDGVPLGAVYSYYFKNKMFFYQSGIDPEISKTNNKIKSGMATHALAIKVSISRKVEEYDFLVGDLNAYKSQWTKESRSIYEIRVMRKSLKNVLIRTGTNIVRAAKKVMGSSSELDKA